MRRLPACRRPTAAFTLVELLVAIAIIGLLVSLFLPAVQAAREASRRLRCASNLRQQAIGLQNYHDVSRSFPPALAWPDRTLWSAFLLPYVEQGNLRQSLDSLATWVDSPNREACETYLPIYRCPSEIAPRHVHNHIPQRVPCSYTVCSSGRLTRESGPPPHVGRPYSDGIFFINSATRIADVLDGTSHTICVGEVVNIIELIGEDLGGISQFQDHWYIGTPEGVDNEVSESMSSTGVPINSFQRDVVADEKELCFGSRHAGSGAQVAFADGHVQLVSETVSLRVWNAMGSGSRGEVAELP